MSAVAVLRCANVLGDDLVTSLSRALSLPLTPTHRRLRPAAPVRRAGRRGAGDRVRHQPRPRGRLQRGRRRPPPVVARLGAIAGRRPLLLSPVATGLAAAPLGPAGRGQAPARAARPAPVRPGRRQPQAQASRLRVPLYHAPGPSDTSSRISGSDTWSAKPSRHYRYEGDVESFFRHSPRRGPPPD